MRGISAERAFQNTIELRNKNSILNKKNQERTTTILIPIKL
jgi:hypothetical protein